jgi:hypothetical protein
VVIVLCVGVCVFFSRPKENGTVAYKENEGSRRCRVEVSRCVYHHLTLNVFIHIFVALLHTILYSIFCVLYILLGGGVVCLSELVILSDVMERTRERSKEPALYIVMPSPSEEQTNPTARTRTHPAQKIHNNKS